MCDSIEKEFKKLVLSQEEIKYVKKADIYQIKDPFPGREYGLWKRTDCARFYDNQNKTIIKVYLQKNPTISINYTNHNQLIDDVCQNSFLENYQ